MIISLIFLRNKIHLKIISIIILSPSLLDRLHHLWIWLLTLIIIILWRLLRHLLLCLIILLIIILIHTTWTVIRHVVHWHWLDYLLVVDHATTQLVLFLFDCFTVICLVPACWLCTCHQSLVFESLFIFLVVFEADEL